MDGKATLRHKAVPGTIDDMRSIADHWWNEDRRDLFRSIEAIASVSTSPDRIGLCLDIILNDLELYDDPRQGEGLWLYKNEVELAEQLGERLHAAAGETKLVEAGPTAIASTRWADVKILAGLAPSHEGERRLPALRVSYESEPEVDAGPAQRSAFPRRTGRSLRIRSIGWRGWKAVIQKSGSHLS